MFVNLPDTTVRLPFFTTWATHKSIEEEENQARLSFFVYGDGFDRMKVHELDCYRLYMQKVIERIYDYNLILFLDIVHNLIY